MIHLVRPPCYKFKKVLAPAENSAAGIHVLSDAYVGGGRCEIFSGGHGYERLRTKGNKTAAISNVARYCAGVRSAGRVFVMPGYNYNNYFHLVGEVLFAFYRVSRSTDYRRVVLPRKVLRRKEITGLVSAMDLTIATCSKRFFRRFDKVAFYDVNHSRLVNTLCGNERVKGEYREYLSFVKNYFGVSEHGKPSRKLFSARSPKGSRYDDKMGEVEARYLDRGYERVYFSAMTMADQVILMSQASHIAGFHGANLVNLLFCQPGSKVYELFRPGAGRSEAGALRTNTYKMLCNELGMQYHLVEEMA